MAKPARRSGTHREKQQQKQHNETSIVSGKQLMWRVTVVLIGVVLGVLHRNHLAFMFESDRHFSHLSDLEREMTFRTEMGLYFSYFKTLVHAPTLADGLYEITNDNVTEHGRTINTLRRFNLYPEVLIGFLYRGYKSVADARGWKTETCYQTDRGQGLSPIISCNGNPYYFYVNAAFAFGGCVAALIFYYAVLLSDSILGGMIAVASFFFNHGEATRIQWTPPLRETFGYPVFLAQMLLISIMIKHKRTGFNWTLLVAGATMNYMLFWQFASFSMSTQVGSLMLTFVLGYTNTAVLSAVVLGLLLGFVCAFILLFGNSMLLTSLFLSSLISTSLLIILNKMVRLLRHPWLVRAAQLVLFASGTLGIKFAIAHFLNIHDDAHVFDILRAKFTDFSNFHTRLYTCAIEFDFQPFVTYEKLCMTLVLPAGALVAVVYIGYMIRDQVVSALRWSFECNEERAPIVYNVIQMCAYAVISFLIMRLKLFWTPHLCIIAGMLGSKRLIYDLSGGRVRPLFSQAFCVLLLAVMAVTGWSNLQQQWSIKGEYSNPQLEQLFEWVNSTTKPTDAFAGTMPTMANLKLSTHRPIAMHPHYEDTHLRNRVMMSYSVFSRKPVSDVYEIIKALDVQYYIFEYAWCMRNPEKKSGTKAKKKPKKGAVREECSIVGSWDQLDPENRKNTPFCERVHKGEDIAPFKRVFTNDFYTVLKL